MTADPLLDRVTTDSAVCHGQPCIRGTRVPVAVILDALTAGWTTHEIVEHTLTPDDVEAAASYGQRHPRKSAYSRPPGDHAQRQDR